MAKNKKTSAKPAKKAAKAKPAAKVKKAAPPKAKKAPAKKVVAKKAAPKKVAPPPKKVVAAKKETPKKEPAKKVAAPKAEQPVKAEKPVAPKKVEKAEAPPKPTPVVAKPAPPQLNIFPVPNQRPIAHKPAQGVASSEERTRYSEEELKEFEALINRKLDKAREEYKILKDTLNRNNDEGTDATSGGNTKVLEDGAETAEKENLSQLAARQQKYITNLENALVRIKNGTYGICSVTGKLIPKERLIAVPHTTQSIEAKMMQQD
ncbi:transcriptional regulator, TraR/DksA family [Ohtaekwangia koreensis]|jgi:RNA polymerase-binding transcription factor DksA|uniref:Transcriptional regulator, TraR/DksA family n=1 Tax=Ohtaekwangia koreensis TaxID=688867 RepID=A0A1T5LGP0_9BACT|nr:transcriptional regulator, TraR/DksA family [Ohtaekwangia koreensis]